MKKLLLYISFFLIEVTLFGQEDAMSGIIYGENHAFGLTAPEGWVLDNQAGVNQGIYAVFYEKGESWERAVTVMYANTASLEHEPHQTLTQLIEYDLNTFIKEYSDIQIVNGNDILTSDNVTAEIKYLSSKSYGNYEAIAYIDAGKTGVMIVMSSRTKKGFESALDAFESLVKSYVFLADKVIIENK